MPTQNPIPGLTIPNPNDPDATAVNFLAILRWGKTVSPRILSATNPLLAGTPLPTPPYDGYLVQSGVPQLTFTVGQATLNLDRPFPNGILSVQLTIAQINTDYVLAYDGSSTTLQSILVTVSSASLGPIGTPPDPPQPVYIDYRVYGW